MLEMDPAVMIGQTLISCQESAARGDSLVLIECSKDSVTSRYEIVHRQDCCESVGLAHEDMEKVIGKVIKSVLVTTDNDLPPGIEPGTLESFTNTTFLFLTEDDMVGTLRFLGESNGYYSETVEFMGA